MYLRGAITIKIQQAFWSSTKRASSSSSLRNVICSRHDIAKTNCSLAVKQQPLTRPLTPIWQTIGHHARILLMFFFYHLFHLHAPRNLILVIFREMEWYKYVYMYLLPGRSNYLINYVISNNICCIRVELINKVLILHLSCSVHD